MWIIRKMSSGSQTLACVINLLEDWSTHSALCPESNLVGLGQGLRLCFQQILMDHSLRNVGLDKPHPTGLIQFTCLYKYSLECSHAHWVCFVSVVWLIWLQGWS